MGAIRVLRGAAIAALFIMPLAASAAPSPSPALATILAKPPSADFTEVTTANLHGSFTAHDWAATNAGTVSAAQTETTLLNDGFVSGYGKTWLQRSSGHVLLEAVIAFAGGNGAKNAFAAFERSDKADASYKGPETLAGIGSYYGARLVNTKNNTFADEFVFLKANDVFLIAVASPKDDALLLASSQTKAQYASAPASTIPSSQWPENSVSSSVGSNALGWLVGIVIFLGLLIVVAIAATVVQSRRADQEAGPADAGTVEAPSVVPQPTPVPVEARPVRIPTVHAEDLYAVGAAAISSLCLTWLAYWLLSPQPGVLGFLLVWLAAFSAMYWLATRRVLGPLFAADRLIAVVITAGAVVMLGPLVLIITFVAYKGFAVITPHFFVETANVCGQLDAATCGGVGHAILGTLEQVGIATLISVPLAILCAVFLNEIGGPMARPVRLFVDAMSGVPSIVAGLFIYAVWVVGLQRGFSGFAASLALAILMLPTITRTAEVVLRLVPDGLREGSLALGGTEWRTVWQVVLPTARSGLITAVILGVARAVGETAPLLLTSFGSSVMNADPFHGAQEALPHYVYEYVRFNPGTGPYQRAWAAAAVLTGLVLGLFTAARLIGALTSIEARQARANRRRTSSARPTKAARPAEAGA